MWILSIDTATKVSGLALTKDKSLVAECFLHTSKTHSERLMPMIIQMLENAGIGFEDLSAVAVASGPGSFTGLRIGMATAKGIAQVRKIPIVGINTLDSLAQNGLGFEGSIAPILDARKNEVYTALYNSSKTKIERVAEYRAVTPKVLVEELRDNPQRILLVGDAVKLYSDMFLAVLGERVVFLPDGMTLPRGSNLGLLAARRLESGDYDELYTLKPFYIRPSEAEVTWAKKFGRKE